MAPLRHQLAYVRPSLLLRQANASEDGRIRAALLHWSTQHLPLVVTRQTQASAGESVRLGLPLPAQWDRLRTALEVDLCDILFLSEFPELSLLASTAGPDARGPLDELSADLGSCGLRARVYGSHGWQCLTGLRYTHAHSDLDLLVHVNSLAAADAAAESLRAFETGQPQAARLDGELVFPDSTAVAWREWMPWRTGRTRQLLIKQAEGVALTDALTWRTTA